MPKGGLSALIIQFERHLREAGLSENTITSYLFAVQQFNKQYHGITLTNLRDYDCVV